MTEEELREEEKRLEFIFDSKEELEKKLEDAINNEDYELASIIRDELRSRE
jgi:protein-arginine kinase activator protein McsA